MLEFDKIDKIDNTKIENISSCNKLYTEETVKRPPPPFPQKIVIFPVLNKINQFQFRFLSLLSSRLLFDIIYVNRLRKIIRTHINNEKKNLGQPTKTISVYLKQTERLWSSRRCMSHLYLDLRLTLKPSFLPHFTKISVPLR